MKRWWAAALVGLCTVARAQSEIAFKSLDRHDGQAVELKAWWFAAPTKAPAPAVVLLHGCGGVYDRQGRIGERMRHYAALLNGLGQHALVVDSLTPRGEREICTQRTGTRAITQSSRRLDALAALQWLAQRPDVDARHLGLMGWSNGGSAVLSSTNLQHRAVVDFPVKPAFAVAFYAGCAADLKRGYRPSAPLLMLVGEADDWTPAAPCHELASGLVGQGVEIEGYASAYHGFDSSAPVRLRPGVPNGVNPGAGVHVGGQAEAWRRSRERLLQFLQAQR